MAEVKWIKLDVALPDNKKIKRIRKLPDGNNVILFWVFLLSRAGESNQKGGLFFTENVPYTEEDLAADFDFSVEFVRFAIMTLEKYRMIELYDRVIFIKNWDEYQQMDKLEKIQEQNRIRQAKYREKQQKLAQSNVTLTLPVTEDNASDIDKDLELDKELDKEKKNKDQKPSSAELTNKFESLWKLYPNKKGKPSALKSYKKAIKNGVTDETIKQGIENYNEYLAKNTWLKPAHGSTWFNQERWTDEYDDQARSGGYDTSEYDDFF